MGDKEFVVRSSKTGESLIIEDKSLAKALEKEGLNPAIWKEVKPEEKLPEAPFGED